MKRINVEEMTQKVNEFRVSNKQKTFTGAELVEALHKIGFSKNVVSYLIKVFPFERMGATKLFVMPKDPIYKDLVAKCYNKNAAYKKSQREAQKPEKSNDQKIVDNFQREGLILCKRVFDEKSFAKDNPLLYSKYCKYVPVTV